MDYDQLREVLVNDEGLYTLWQSTGLDEEEFIRANGTLIKETEKNRLAKEKTKARQLKFIEKQKAAGKRTLTAIVSGETYDRVSRHRDAAIRAGEKKSLGEVLDELLYGNTATGQDQDKSNVIKIMAGYRAAGDTWQDVADKLNARDIKTARAKEWTKSNAGATYRRGK